MQSCLVENEGDTHNEKVTFLYKLEKGVCPKSYGFNVAKLAGLPAEIISRAVDISSKFEESAKNRKLLKNLMASKDPRQMRQLLLSLKV